MNDHINSLWLSVKTWFLVMLSFSLISISIAFVVYGYVEKSINDQLNIIKLQSQRSIEDVKHLNIELENTRASLKRIEKAVKTVIDPLSGD